MSAQFDFGTPDPWEGSASRLARWTLAHLVNRDDCWGAYSERGTFTDPADPQRRRPGRLTAGLLRVHFAGGATIGVHSTGHDGMCRWLGFDLDAKDGPKPANLPYALLLLARLSELGLRAILERSNGGDGYHIWVIFARPQPFALLHSFGEWVVKDCQEHGVERVEVFPKQERVTKYGNWLRLPGRHPRRGTWSEFWDGSRWVSGVDAPEFLLSAPADNAADGIPEDARSYVPEPPERKPSGGSGQLMDGDEWQTQFVGDLRTLDIVRLCKDEDILIGKGALENQWNIVCPWIAGHSTEDRQTDASVWVNEGGYPSFSCFHESCRRARRGLRDLAEYFGKEEVESYCAEPFPSAARAAEYDEEVAKLFQRDAAATAAGAAEQTPDADVGGTKANSLANGTTLKADPVASFAGDLERRKAKPEADAIAAAIAEKQPAEPVKKKRQRFLLSVAELEKMPNLEYLIDKHLPAKGLTVIYGPSGAGKTFFGLDMALSAACGIPYLGQYKLRPSRVLYIAAEGGTGAKMRVMAWKKYRGQAEPPVDRFGLIPFTFNLMEPQEVKEVLEITAEGMGAYPDMIYLDTLARLMAGDENKTADMSHFVRATDALRETTGAAVVVVHHTGKDESRNERGSIALRCAADQVLSVAKIDNQFSTMKCEKDKEGEEWGAYRAEKHVIELPELGLNSFGNGYSSLALTFAGEKNAVDGVDVLTAVVLALEQSRMNKEELMKATGIAKHPMDGGIKTLRTAKVISYGGHDKKFGLCENHWMKLENLKKYHLVQGDGTGRDGTSA